MIQNQSSIACILLEMLQRPWLSFNAGSLNVQDSPPIVHADIFVSMGSMIALLTEKSQGGVPELFTPRFIVHEAGCGRSWVRNMCIRLCSGHYFCLRTVEEAAHFAPLFSPAYWSECLCSVLNWSLVHFSSVEDCFWTFCVHWGPSLTSVRRSFCVWGLFLASFVLRCE